MEEKNAKFVRSFDHHKYLPIAISFIALIVSCWSLYIGYLTNERDIKFKELNIRPIVDFHFASTGTSSNFGLTNQGIGPAQIDWIAYIYGNTCAQSRKRIDIRNEGIAGLLQEIIDQYESYITANIPQDIAANFDFTFQHKVNAVASGRIIPASSNMDILTLNTIVSEVKDAFPTAGSPKMQQQFQKIKHEIRNAFHFSLKNVGMSLSYCSLSGETCEKITFGNSDKLCEQ